LLSVTQPAYTWLRDQENPIIIIIIIISSSSSRQGWTNVLKVSHYWTALTVDQANGHGQCDATSHMLQ
jgi:hypothetical protein